jgi:adenylosuccinate lyase
LQQNTIPDHSRYENPLITRYASPAMARLWSAQTKHATWRRLWVALAEAERELGLDISAAQIAEMWAGVDDIDFGAAADYERRFRHDVMAHAHAFGDRCPSARGIIHLGATSCFVTDNTELIQIRDSLRLIISQLVPVIDQLATFAEQHRDLPCLAFTHLQTAQPTTVGKRVALWCYDLVLDLEELEHRLPTLKFRGVKGTTGTQASFLSLFNGDHEKVQRLDRLVAEKMGFAESYPVTGQTYSRKVDAQVLSALSGVAQSAHKAGTDIRILQHRRELEEPFETSQIGSSAMAYKRNPMRSERMCSLARFAMNLTANAEQTAAVQWMERTLDDSANRRLSLPQAFLAVDAVLILYRNISDGLVVYPKVIERNLREELPFIATEELLMAGVQAGGDRQELHEIIRLHSQAAADRIKRDGAENDLLQRLKKEPVFAGLDFDAALDPRRFIGRAPQQVDEFLAEVIAPIRERYRDALQDEAGELRV